MSNFNTVVIGSGVAGMTAALYLKRANVEVLLLEKGAPGGQINQTAQVENYPGFLSIDGPTLAMNIFTQINELKIPYRYGKVIDVIDEGDKKRIITDREEVTCQNIIIASGRKARELGLENEKQLTGRGVSWCAICDGVFFKDRPVAVVGGGNSALEEALYLADITSQVILIHRRDEFRGDPILQEKVKNNPKIEIHYDSRVIALRENDQKLSGIEVDHQGEKEFYPVEGLFIFIGFEPDTDFLEHLNLVMDHGYVVVDATMHTNLPHVYACGDVIKKELYQITTAVGEGAQAAMSVKRDQMENE